MKFSLRNILIVIGFLALWLGLILSDGDKKIRARAVKLREDLLLIEKSKSFAFPITQEELDNSIQSKLSMK